MVAFSASKFVCAAMSLISVTTSPILRAASASPCTFTFVFPTSPTAWEATRAASATCRLISEIEEESSSDASATDCTLVDAWSDAIATAAAFLLVSSAVPDIDCAAACISSRPTRPSARYP